MGTTTPRKAKVALVWFRSNLGRVVANKLKKASRQEEIFMNHSRVHSKIAKHFPEIVHAGPHD
jgi:hypothetical protein